jgi:hypothetical protein
MYVSGTNNIILEMFLPPKIGDLDSKYCHFMSKKYRNVGFS